MKGMGKDPAQPKVRLKMDYENFKEQFIEQLQEELYGKGVEARFDTKAVEKLNNEGYDAVTVTPAESNIGVTLNVEAFHKAYEDGASMSEVVSRASDTVIRGFENQPMVDVASLMDYEQMKDKLVMEVVSTETNAEMLASVPHHEMEDMSVVYRFVIDSNEDGRATILATNNMIEAMGVTPEQLHEDALKNAPELKPAVITGMSEVMAEMMGMSPEEMAMMGMPTDPADEQMYVATVPDKIHGAGVLAYQDFMDQASDRIGGGSFFILPSSVHEVLIVPDNGQMSLHELESMVREVNATQVAPEDKLTDNVYHYDAEAKVFELGEKFVERQAEKEADVEKTAEKESVLGDLKAKKDEVAKQPKKETVDKAKGRGGEAI